MATTHLQRRSACRQTRRCRFSIGFTLLELLVATTVLSLMLLFLFSVFDQSTKAWQAGERKIDAFREARAALFMVRRDLSGALISKHSPMVFNRLNDDIPFSGALAPPSTGSNLFFLTRLPLNAQGANNASSLCSVGYYVAWMRSAVGSDQASNFSFNLIRYFIPSGAPTSTNGTGAHLLQFIKSGSDPGSVNTLFPRVGSAVAPENEVLARNIIKFDLVPYSENGSGLAPSPAGVLDEIPSLMEITLVVINHATAAKLGDAQSQWDISSSPMRALIQENAQTFRSRLTLKP